MKTLGLDFIDGIPPLDDRYYYLVLKDKTVTGLVKYYKVAPGCNECYTTVAGIHGAKPATIKPDNIIAYRIIPVETYEYTK